MSQRPDTRMTESSALHDRAEDAELAHAITRGDAQAPSAVWRRYAPLVRRIVRRSFGPEYDVEDLVQDVFLRLFAKIGTLRDASALRAFLVSITVLTVRHEIRRRRVRRMVGLASGNELSELRVVPPDAAPRQALNRFYAILDKLSSRERTAFVLRYIEEMTDQEVAAALSVSVATARRACAHAYERVSLHARNDPFLADLLPHGKQSA